MVVYFQGYVFYNFYCYLYMYVCVCVCVFCGWVGLYGQLSQCMGLNSNGSSLPPHLPGLSLVLKGLNAQSSTPDAPIYTIVSLSYRGYWTSRGRPSQKGVALDAAATTKWVSQRYPADSKLVLWGQSLGAGVAAGAVAAQIENTPSHKLDAVMAPRGKKQRLKIDGLLLETPFTSIRDMLVAIYPQK